jgi:hypothetical protein
MATDTTRHHEATFHGTIDSITDDAVVVRIAHSKYQLHLAAPANGHNLEAGQRVHGIVRGEALRMHPAQGGGKFIEPVWGPPRIVAGVVLEADEAARTVTVDAVAIFKLTVPAEQKWNVLAPGTLVNFYIKSGATLEVHE